MATIFDRTPTLAPASGVARGRKGVEALQGTLDEFLYPEYLGSQRRRGKIEQAFLPTLDPRQGVSFVTQGAERIIGDLLRPGGEVTEGIRRARGQAISSGFGTEGGDLSRQESSLIADALRSGVGAFIGQGLPGLYEGAAGRGLSAYGLTQQLAQENAQSLFTGQAGIEALRQSKGGVRDWMQRNIPIIGGLF